MFSEDTIQLRFLEELQALEGFRARYKELHPWVPMEKGDPDLRHLIEAQAFFAARAQSAMARSEERLHRRLFAQFFPYLLTAEPAVGIVEAQLRSTQVEPVVLPKGTEVQLTASGGASARFLTQAQLRVLPIRLARVSHVTGASGGGLLRLRLESWVPRNRLPLGRLRLHLRHLDDYWPSLEAWMALRDHLISATVRYGELGPEGPALECAPRFGELRALEDALDAHPLEVCRDLFHFPEGALFIELDCPMCPDRWQMAEVELRVDAEWPEHLRLNLGSFHLHAVPVINALEEPAEPIRVDGTRRRWPIRHPDPAQGMTLHSVRSVYCSTTEGLTPLRPGVIVGRSGGYEIDPGTEGEPHPQLVVDMPEAFREPRLLSVNARWSQPSFDAHLGEQLRVRPFRRSAAALNMAIIGNIKRHQPPAMGDQAKALTQALTLRMKPRLDLDEVQVLLTILGRDGDSPYRNTQGYLTALEVREVALGDGQGLAFLYAFEIGEVERSARFKVKALLELVHRVLDSWIPGAGVRVEGRSARLGLTLNVE